MEQEKQSILNDIADLEQELAELREREQELEANENPSEYDDMLDEVYGMVNVCGYEYESSRLLKEIDPTAYDCGHSDYNSSLLSDIQSEIEDKVAEIEKLKKTL